MRNQKSITRRDFIKKATAFAVGAPCVIASSALGAEGRAAPSGRLTMGIIGPGIQGRGLMGNFMRFPDTQMVAVAEVSTVRREHARDTVERYYSRAKRAGTFKGCATYKDFRKLLARDDIDAVIIAVPDHWHAIPVIEAAKAGKDIYCEKPLSLTIREAREMVRAVRKYKRIFQTGSQQRSEDNFLRACELVQSGRIGKVQTVHVNVGPPSRDCDLPEQPIPEGLDWNFWLGPAPYRGYNEEICPKGVYNFFPHWRNYRDYSGGMMTDWGAHHFDIAQWGLGMDNSGPVEIIPPDGKKYKTLTYKYANGVIMYHDPGGVNGVLFTGTKGKIEVNRGHFKAEPESIAKEPLGPGDVHLYKSNNHYRNFLDCVHSRKLPICDVEIGCRSVTVCHLGNLAYWNKRPLKWDPKKGRFIGDDEANTWLDRPKRAPWKLPAI